MALINVSFSYLKNTITSSYNTTNFTTDSITTIEEQQKHDKVQYNRSHYLEWLAVISILRVIVAFSVFFFGIRNCRRRCMEKAGAAALLELKERVELELREEVWFQMHLGPIVGIEWNDEGLSDAREQEAQRFGLGSLV